MNRELKFRAWDKDEKYMSKGSTIKNVCLNVNSANFEWDDSLPIMQFTGLKDKNKKEIYEGDIIVHNNRKLIVEFVDCGFALKQKNGTYWKDFNHVTKYMEVIGNIYENPELLHTGALAGN